MDTVQAALPDNRPPNSLSIDSDVRLLLCELGGPRNAFQSPSNTPLKSIYREAVCVSNEPGLCCLQVEVKLLFCLMKECFLGGEEEDHGRRRSKTSI